MCGWMVCNKKSYHKYPEIQWFSYNSILSQIYLIFLLLLLLLLLFFVGALPKDFSFSQYIEKSRSKAWLWAWLNTGIKIMFSYVLLLLPLLSPVSLPLSSTFLCLFHLRESSPMSLLSGSIPWVEKAPHSIVPIEVPVLNLLQPTLCYMPFPKPINVAWGIK